MAKKTSLVAEAADDAGEVYVRVIRASALPAKSQQLPDSDLFQEIAERLVAPPVDPERLWQLYEECGPHAACINAKVTDAVGQGWYLKEVDEDADEEDEEEDEATEDELELAPAEEPEPEAEESPEVTLASRQRKLQKLLEKLTPELTFGEMLEQAAREQEAVGWACWEVVRDKGTLAENETADLPDISALYPLPAHTMRVGADKEHKTILQVRGGKRIWFKRFGVRSHYNRETGRKAKDINEAKLWEEKDKLAHEVIVFKGYSPRSQWYGVPKWLAATPAIAELACIRDYNVNWYGSGGMADRSVHVVAKSKEVAKQVADTIVGQMTAAAGTGHVTIVTSGTEDVKVEIQEFTPNQTGRRDGQFSNRREELTKEVLIVHSVPPYRVGWAEIGSLSGSAAKEMLRAYRQGAVEPIQELMEDRLAHTLFSEDGIPLGDDVRFTLTDLAWDVMELNIDLADKAVSSAAFSPNDARELLGKPRSDKPGMDDHYLNGKPLDQAGMPDTPAAPPTGGLAPDQALDAFTQALELARRTPEEEL